MYKKLALGSIRRASDGATIPPDPANSDYAKYLLDAQAGAIVLPEDPVDPNIAVHASIAALESGSLRALREAVLGDPAAVTRLRTMDDAIKAKRLTLK